MLEAARRAATVPGVRADQPLQEQHRQQGRLLRRARELPLRRDTPFATSCATSPFFVTRQVVCGAGRVGLGQDGATAGFQISQRADFFEVEVGLETTLKRPIVNTRDEPHADADRYRRLHVIIGDANLAEISTYLKVGTTALVLAMIEEKLPADDLTIAQPVRELHDVSHDPSLQHHRPADRRPHDHRAGPAGGVPRPGAQVRRRPLGRRRRRADPRRPRPLGVRARPAGRDPMQLAGELDWVAKLRLLEGYRDATGSTGTSPRLQLVDLQYSDVRPEKGLYHRLVARGAMETLLDRRRVRRAMTTPPEDTRAYFRGECLRRYAAAVAAASLGLGDLRRRPRVAGPGADARAAAGHQGARRRAARRVSHRGRSGRGAHPRVTGSRFRAFRRPPR